MDAYFDPIIRFLTGNFPFSSELQALGMAYQGHILVRNGRNKDLSMNWFHAFMLGVVSSFGGSAFAPLWLGRPSAILSNDVNLFCLVMTFLWTYYTPLDIGYHLGNTLLVSILCTSLATLFRTMGIVGYCSIAFELLKSNPSKYYHIPIVGPIVWATLLGNMSAFFVKGFDGHLAHGMPWNFQNGLVCASFYHFYVHDQIGPIGIALRDLVHRIPDVQMGLDDRTFAVVVVSSFMQVMYILQLPEFFGPMFSPFSIMQRTVQAIITPKAPALAPKVPTLTSPALAAPAKTDASLPEVVPLSKSAKRKRNKKNKVE